MQQKDIMNVRRAVDANIGRRVRVRANKGRHKYSVAEGVIQESYPSIFTVRINADEDNHLLDNPQFLVLIFPQVIWKYN